MKNKHLNGVLALFAVVLMSMSAIGFASATNHTDTGSGDGLNDPDTFGDAEDDGLDWGTDTDTQTGDGINDPDTFGDPEDDGLDWNGDGVVDQNDEPTDMNGDGTVNNSDAIIVADNQRSARSNTATTGVNTSPNTTRSNTSGQTGTTQTTTTTTTGDTRSARTTASDNQDAAEQYVNNMGDYVLVDSESFDTEEPVYVYVYERASTAFDDADVSEENLDRIGVTDAEGLEPSDTRNARATQQSDLVYIVASEGEVKGAIMENAFSFMPPTEDDARGARDADGFITVQRNADAVDDRWRDARMTSTSTEEQSDNDSTAPWNNIGGSSDDDQEDEQDEDTSSNSNLPAYVR